MGSSLMSHSLFPSYYFFREGKICTDVDLPPWVTRHFAICNEVILMCVCVNEKDHRVINA